MLDRLLADRAEPTTRKLAAQLVAHPVGRGVAQGLERLAELAAERRERSVATVRSAIPLTTSSRSAWPGPWPASTVATSPCTWRWTPTLVGGLVIQVGDEVIDGSVAGRLDELGRRLG